MSPNKVLQARNLPAVIDPGEPYNPLDRVNLGKSIETAFLARPCVPLPPPEPFVGAGLYALYYSGPFPAYGPISRSGCDVPIYVGKAVPAGARSGAGSLLPRPAPELFNRLSNHAESIRQARNLQLDDFRCRYLIVDDIWIPLGETLLIRYYRPVWNVVVSGFGKNDPGERRRSGRRSHWDELHPGRWWSKDEAPATYTSQEIEARITTHFQINPAPPPPPPAASSGIAEIVGPGTGLIQDDEPDGDDA